MIDEAKDAGNDGCIFQNVQDGGDFDTIYVVFDNTQIKSADPVTYDDDGNVIPLSQRFNEQEEDIRYSTVSQYTAEELKGIAKNWSLTWGFYNDILNSNDMYVIDRKALNFLPRYDKSGKIKGSYYAYNVNGKTVIMHGTFANPSIDYIVTGEAQNQDFTDSLKELLQYAKREQWYATAESYV